MWKYQHITMFHSARINGFWLWFFLFPLSYVWPLLVYMNVLTQLHVRSCEIIVITVKELARHWKQYPSFRGWSLTEAPVTRLTHAYSGGEHVYPVVTYCKEVMTKNEHSIWAAYFLPSISVRRCVLSPSLMASQRRQIHSCASPRRLTAVSFMWCYYLPSAKCVRVRC